MIDKTIIRYINKNLSLVSIIIFLIVFTLVIILNPDDNDGFKNFFKDFHKAKILNDTAKIEDSADNENIKNIKQLLKIKDFIGKICWFILAGTLSISVMNNSMNDI